MYFVHLIIWLIGLLIIVLTITTVGLMLVAEILERIRFYRFKEDYYYLLCEDRYNSQKYNIPCQVIKLDCPILYIKTINCPKEIDLYIPEEIHIRHVDRLKRLTQEEKVELL